MKRILQLGLVTFLCFSIIGCADDNKDEEIEDTEEVTKDIIEEDTFTITEEEQGVLDTTIASIKERIPGIEVVLQEKLVQEYETGKYLEIELLLENKTTGTKHTVTYTEDLKIRGISIEVTDGDKTLSGNTEYTEAIQALFPIEIEDVLAIQVDSLADLSAKTITNHTLGNYVYSVFAMTDTVTYYFNDQSVISTEKPYVE